MERFGKRALVTVGLLLLGTGCQAPSVIGAGGSGGGNPSAGGSGGSEPMLGPGDLGVIDDTLLSACFQDATPIAREQVCADHWCADFDGRTLVSVAATTLPRLPIEGRVTIRPRVAAAFEGGSVSIDGQTLEVFDASRDLVGAVGLGGVTVSMEVIGETAFVETSSCGRSDIHTVDLSNPAAPRVTSRWSLLEPARDRAYLEIVGRASGELVIRAQRVVAFVGVSTPEAPQIARLGPWPFENGYAWDVDANDQFYVIAGGVDGREPMAFVYPTDSDVVHEIEIQQESTPVLEEDLLVVATREDGVRIMRLDPANAPEVLSEVPLQFLPWMPPKHAGFAFLRSDVVVDLRDPAFTTYQLIDSLEEDCAIELYDEAGDRRVGLAPFLAPDQRFAPEALPDHDCGVTQLFDILIESAGTQALATPSGASSALRIQPDSLQPVAFSVRGRVVAWAEGRLLTIQSEGFDFSLPRKDTFRVYTDDGGEPPIAELTPPGPVVAIARHGARAAILAEPAPRDYDEPAAPVTEHRLFLLDFASSNPVLQPVDAPEGVGLLRAAIDADAIYALSTRGELHRWPHDGAPASRSPFVSDDVGRLFATPSGVFAETHTGYYQTDGITVRRVAPPIPSALLVGSYAENLLWYLPRGHALVQPEDDHIIVASPVTTDTTVEMTPQAAVGIWDSSVLGVGDLFVVGPPGLTFYATP